MKKNLFVLFYTLIIVAVGHAQKKQAPQPNGYVISIATKNIQNEKLLLYMQYGTSKKQIVTDSTVIKTNDQKIEFKEDKKIIGAIYFFKLASQSNPIELAIDNGARFSITINDKNIDNLQVNNSDLNKDFINFQRQNRATSVEEKTAARTLLMQKYPTSVLHLYLAIENKIVAPIPTTDVEKIGYRDTYFNFMKRDDKRVYLLPNINKFLYRFIQILPITNENYIANIEVALKGLDCNAKSYAVLAKYFLSNLTFFESKNLELAYNHLYTNYVKDNPCKSFTNSDLNSYSNRFDTNQKVPMGATIPDAEFITKDSVAYSLSKIYTENDYTFIAFYSPSCPHCEEKMPQVAAYFNTATKRLPNKKIQLVAILNDVIEEKWQSFIIAKNLTNVLNLKSTDATRKYQQDLNAFSNPSYYLVDKTGTVLLKSFNTQALNELMQN